MASTNAVVGKG